MSSPQTAPSRTPSPRTPKPSPRTPKSSPRTPKSSSKKRKTPPPPNHTKRVEQDKKIINLQKNTLNIIKYLQEINKINTPNNQYGYLIGLRNITIPKMQADIKTFFDPSAFNRIKDKLDNAQQKINTKIVNGQKNALEERLTANVVNKIVRNLKIISQNLKNLNDNSIGRRRRVQRTLNNQFKKSSA